MRHTTLIVSSLAALAVALPLVAAQAYESGSHKYNGNSSYNSNKHGGSHRPTVTYQAPRPADDVPVWNGHKPSKPSDPYATGRRDHDDGDEDTGYRRGHYDSRGWSYPRLSDRDDEDYRPWHHRRHKRWWWHAWR